MDWPDFSAQAGSRRFEAALLAEHADEAAFLHQQRRGRVAADDAWTTLQALEARLEAHLDALAVAGARGVECAAERAREGGAAELFVAACLACRRGDWPALRQLALAVDPAAEGHGQALADAVYVEAPRQWGPQLAQLLQLTRERTPPQLVAACGRRRFPVAPVLLGMLRFPACAAAAAQALGRLPEPAAVEPLRACLHAPDDATRSAALVALCRLSHRQCLQQAAASRGTWWHEAAGLAGGAAEVQALLQALQDGASPQRETVLALGLLGDPAAIPVLLGLLGDPQRADDAARALDWMTGAGLVEEGFVADEVDEAALGADELRAWKESAQAPRRSDGSPFGTRLRQRVREPQAWRAWLAAHAGAFVPGRCYRLGRPRSASVLAEGLALEYCDALLRAAMAQELALRFGCTLPLETDLPVLVQQRLVHRAAAWAAAQEAERPLADPAFVRSCCAEG